MARPTKKTTKSTSVRIGGAMLLALAALLAACSGPDEQAWDGEDLPVRIGFVARSAGAETTQPASSVEDLHGQTVAGAIDVFAEVGGWARSVRFIMDGEEIAVVEEAPFSVTVDTTTYADGAHTLVVEPSMPNGRLRGVSQATFTIDNANPPVEPSEPEEPGEPGDPEPGDPEPTPTPPPPSTGTSAEVRLLGGYWQMVRNNLGGREQQAREMRYHPWQFEAGADMFFNGSSIRWVVDDPGDYRGWDYLATREHRHASVNYPAMDYLYLRLERDASVAVVWYGSASSLPGWLSSWQRGGDVVVRGSARATFRKVLPAGEHYLGTNEGRNVQMYSVLLGEADGSPSPQPTWPSEYGERVQPNTVIPRDHVLHNIHFAQGPDGRTYPTWHEQIDPTYWAYFEHDHGSDPSLFTAFPDVQPVWAYTDPRIKDDYFFGFKVFVADITTDDGRELSLMITAHLDNLTRRRLCERFHTLDVAIADRASGELLMRTHMLADVGYPRDEGLNTRVKPGECPEVMDIGPNDTSGRRNINKDSPGAYESWQYDFAYARALPFIGGIAIMQQSPLTVMGLEKDSDGNYTAEHLIYADTPGMGTGRHFQFSGSRFGVDARTGPSGAFCTDRYGRDVVDCGSSGALQQFIKPGFNFTITPAADLPRWGVDDPWRAPYTPKTVADRNNGAVVSVWRNLENAVRPSN